MGKGLTGIRNRTGNTNRTCRTGVRVPTDMRTYQEVLLLGEWITAGSIPEEPGAVVPHAGICAGDAGQPAFLP